MSDIGILWKLIEDGRKGKNIGTSTGLSKLDKLIGGIQDSRYYLISSQSSGGKTSLVLFFMYQMLRNSTDPVYFIYYSLELGSEILLAKLMALYCAEEFGIYLTTNNVLSFDSILTDENYEYLRKAKEWIQSIEDRLIIFDSGLSARILYKTTIPILQKLGKIEEIDGREIYIPNNPNQKVIGVIDHALLLKLEEGRKIKEEIDLTSSYMVTLKRKYRISWFMIMQQNRESSSMDRRKADLSEPGLNDIMASSAPVNDSDVTLQIFYPAREKLSTCRGYKILSENGGGLRDTYRGLIISKNRYGIANQVLNCGFYGSVGWWTELPLPEQITDIKLIREPSLNIPCKTKRIIQQDLSENDIDKEIIRTNIEYTF